MGHLARLSSRTTAAAAGALLLVGGLTGPALAGGPGPGSDPAPPSVSCGTETGAQQLARWGGTLPRPFGKGTTADNAWDLDSADTSTYNQCAELSWITLTVKGATASSPHMVLLFHHNEYVGTTTVDPFGFEPTVTRVDTGTLDVTYHYMLSGDSNARPSGLAHSTYTWGVRTDVLSEHGDLPPGQE